MLKCREHVENNVEISKCNSRATEASIVHFSADCRQSWKHSARCVKPAKPARNMPQPLSTMCRPDEQDVNRAQKLNQPLHVEKRKNSFQKPPCITTILSRNWTTPKATATAETPQFSARPNQDTCRCTSTSASKTIPRTVPVRSSRSAAQCALCVPRSACSWNIRRAVEELNQVTQKNGHTWDRRLEPKWLRSVIVCCCCWVVVSLCRCVVRS